MREPRGRKGPTGKGVRVKAGFCRHTQFVKLPAHARSWPPATMNPVFSQQIFRDGIWAIVSVQPPPRRVLCLLPGVRLVNDGLASLAEGLVGFVFDVFVCRRVCRLALVAALFGRFVCGRKRIRKSRSTAQQGEDVRFPRSLSFVRASVHPPAAPRPVRAPWKALA